MKRRSALPLVLVCVCGLALTVPAADSPQIRAPAPVKSFSLPFFNDEGFRTRLIRGNEARLTDPRRPELRDVTISLFKGDASNQIETVILSTDATVDTDAQFVTGVGSVRVVSDDFELSGEQWRYDYKEAGTINILIQRKARIVMQAELQSLLK